MADSHTISSRSNRDAEIIDLGGESETSEVSSSSRLDGSSGDLKTDIEKCLDAVHSAGTFASFGNLEPFIDPQIIIGDGDHIVAIDLPLSEDHAQAIIRASHQAPFGKGSEMIVDVSVRKTWELNVQQFQLRNCAWQQYLHKLVKKVADELGVPGGAETIQAHLYKMLLYERGGLFKAHTDTEKELGMFGTLVISLPSKHEGGEVVVRHGKETKRFRTEDFEHSYISWYSDVKHEITEVTSGYRWVLTYNLVHSKYVAQPPTAADTGQDLRFLRAIFKRWREDIKVNISPHKVLVYLLDHQYTDHGLRHSTLKGRDLVKAQFLEQVCEQTDYCFYLASLERTVAGGADEGYYHGYYSEDEHHSIFDICDESLKLTRVINLDGTVVGTDIDIDESNIVQQNPFEDRAPDEEDYEGYTGNEGAYATHWYRDTVLVFMPKECQISLFLLPFRNGPRNGREIDELIAHLVEQLIRKPQNPQSEQDLLRACEFVTSHNINFARTNKDNHNAWLRSRFPNKTFSSVVKASWLLKRCDLFLSATLSVEGQLPLDCFSDVGTLLRLFGFSALHEGLNKAVEPISTIWGRVEAIQKIQGSDGVTHTQSITDSEFLSWALQRLKEVMVNRTWLSQRDGVALGHVMNWEYFGDALFETAVALAKEHATITPFVVSLLVTMPSASEAHKTAWSDILRRLTREFSLCHNPEMEFEPRSWAAERTAYTSRYGSTLPSIYGASRSEKVRNAPIEPESIVELLRICLSEQEFDREAQIILEKVISEADRMDARDFRTMLLPFLKGLTSILQAQQTPLTESRYKSLYQSVLSSYIKRYVGMQPSRSRDWKRAPVSCTCGDCDLLNNFLQSPTERVGRFPMAEKRRKHLHYKLDNGDYVDETERRGSPYTLVVTKTERAFAKTLADWRKRVQEARQQILTLGDENLEVLLGDRYEEITQLSQIKLPEAETMARRGTKRKAITASIDLTGDE